MSLLVALSGRRTLPGFDSCRTLTTGKEFRAKLFGRCFRWYILLGDVH